MPLDETSYLVLIRRNRPPVTPDDLRIASVELLRRLVEQADRGTILEANRLLESRLPEEWLMLLPDQLFLDPTTPEMLLWGPMAEESKLQRWREGLADALKLPQADQKEAEALLDELDLVLHLDGLA